MKIYVTQMTLDLKCTLRLGLLNFKSFWATGITWLIFGLSMMSI